jgi:cobalt-zinc-cadmium efflux system outer membrane protein
MTAYSLSAILSISMVLSATDIRAQSLASRYLDTQNGLSLGDAIARALQEEPALRAARTEIDAARGMRRQAGLWMNPSISFERREEPAGTDHQTMIGVEFPLELFLRPARMTAADRELEATERSVADRVRLVTGEVRVRYGEAATAIRDVVVAESVLEAATREFELVRQRVEQGASSPLERDLLDVETRRFQSEQLLAAGRAEAAMFELKRTLGMNADAPLQLREALEELAPLAEAVAPQRNESAIQERPDVREAETRVRLADALIDRARSEGRIDVNLFGSYMRMDAGFMQQGFGEAGNLERVRGVFKYVAGGAMVMVPLWNRNQGEVAAARAARDGAAARLEATRLAAQSEIAAAASQDLHARRARAAMEGGVRLARRNLDVIRQTYELGRATISDVLVEQRRYLETEHAYTATLRAAFEAQTALQLARGE